jgi:tripartite-type tricarboxylate transporter receptor subunit TctC
MLKVVVCGAIAFCLPILGWGEAAAQSSKLTMVIGYTPGAAYDIYARTIARHLGKHLPGRPAVIPQNMAGAGSLKAANFLYNNAAGDGSTIGTFARGLAMQPLLDNQGIAFDARRFNWLGSPSAEVSVVFAWHTTPFRTMDDARERQMVIPATGSGANSAIFPFVLNAVIGTKCKVVLGYPGQAETMIAIERGEADGSAGSSWSYLASARKDWITDKKINILSQIAFKRHPDLPDVPLVMDAAKDETGRKVLELIFSRQMMAYPFVAPPGVAPARVAELRQAFDAVMKDPEFRADAARQSLDIDPISGPEIEAMLQKVYASTPDVIARAKEALQGGKN